MVIALGVYLGVCRVILPDYTAANVAYYETVGVWQGGGALTALEEIGLAVLTELPIWLGCQAIICAASFLMNSVIAANAVTLGAVIGSHYVLGFVYLFLRPDNPLKSLLMQIDSWLPFEILFTDYPGVGRYADLPTPTILEINWATITKGWIIGIFWLIFATNLGLHFFRKKEIK